MSVGGAGQENDDNDLGVGTDDHCSKISDQGGKTTIEVPNDILGMHALYRI
jgi:hypothetical protein